MNKLRGVVAFVTGLALCGLGSLLVVPAVYAATVAPAGGSPGAPATVSWSGGGMAGWEIAVIVVAAASVVALAVAGLARLRLRSGVRPAVQ